MCAGRTPIECYFRGKLLVEDRKEMKHYHYRIKSYGREIMVSFDKTTLKCVTEGWEDLQIVK
jgi:hypothetical protein